MELEDNDVQPAYRIGNSHPALYIISLGGKDDIPTADDVRETIISAIEAEWNQSHNFVLDVHEAVVEFQDEVPPEDPVPAHAVTIVFDQCPATMAFGYEGPFRIAMEAIRDEYGKVQLHIDAIPAIADQR